MMGRLDYESLMQEACEIGIRVEERKLKNGLCGFYYEPLRTVVIDYTMDEAQQRCTLCHELIHARHNDSRCGSIRDKSERRARRETALRLISPIQYASIEEIYPDDMFHMASELDVTLQVLKDYRSLLSELL